MPEPPTLSSATNSKVGMPLATQSPEPEGLTATRVTLVGGMVSMNRDSVAESRLLPAASTARTIQVCAPSATALDAVQLRRGASTVPARAPSMWIS